MWSLYLFIREFPEDRGRGGGGAGMTVSLIKNILAVMVETVEFRQARRAAGQKLELSPDLGANVKSTYTPS